jgi:lysophospholipid acyltransferase (LPLAT)-like uncharacterized protein
LKAMATLEATSSRSRRKARASGVVVPHAARWYERLGAWLIHLLVRSVSATLRYRWDDRTGFFGVSSPQPAIYCTWHNRLALSMAAYYGYARKHNPTKGIAAMVSASKDGAFLAAILECFQVQPVRGSSSRRGAQALLELTTWAEQGYDLAITPDGPRGPCYQVQDGVMSLAQVTGLPIIPVSYDLNWKWRAKSWDRFVIPLPFAKCHVILGKPVRVPREAADDERERLRRTLEQNLKEITGE